MKFSFSTLSCPTWDLPTVVARAKEYDYDGVELPAFFRQSNPTAIDLFAEAAAIPDAFAAADLCVSCVATPVTFRCGRGDADAREAENLKYAVMVARQVNCSIVRLLDPRLIGVSKRLPSG
jgi:sugar phosphate isomerase/epimerase